MNVSAMEGQFSRTYKGPGHPHTNMAKAALNMLTRTSAGEMFETDGILMNAVDTGWITDERPAPGEAADRRRGLARAARPGRRRRPRLRPDRARRGRRGPVRPLPEGLPPQPLVTWADGGAARRSVRRSGQQAPDVRRLAEVLAVVVDDADQPRRRA